MTAIIHCASQFRLDNQAAFSCDTRTKFGASYVIILNQSTIIDHDTPLVNEQTEFKYKF